MIKNHLIVYYNHEWMEFIMQGRRKQRGKGEIAPSPFGESVYPILTRGTDYAHYYLDFQTVLRLCDGLQIRNCIFSEAMFYTKN